MQSYASISETFILIKSKKGNENELVEIWDFLKQDDKILMLKQKNLTKHFINMVSKSQSNNNPAYALS